MSAQAVECLCGRTHEVTHRLHGEPVIQCPLAPPKSLQRVDTRYLKIEDENNVYRVFTGYDGPLWVQGPGV